MPPRLYRICKLPIEGKEKKFLSFLRSRFHWMVRLAPLMLRLSSLAVRQYPGCSEFWLANSMACWTRRVRSSGSTGVYSLPTVGYPRPSPPSWSGKWSKLGLWPGKEEENTYNIGLWRRLQTDKIPYEIKNKCWMQGWSHAISKVWHSAYKRIMSIQY